MKYTGYVQYNIHLKSLNMQAAGSPEPLIPCYRLCAVSSQKALINLYCTRNTTQYKVHTTRGAAHTKGHGEAAIQRQKKNRHFQNTKIENNDDIRERVLLM
jgi:hypothetical protein